MKLIASYIAPFGEAPQMSTALERGIRGLDKQFLGNTMLSLGSPRNPTTPETARPHAQQHRRATTANHPFRPAVASRVASWQKGGTL